MDNKDNGSGKAPVGEIIKIKDEHKELISYMAKERAGVESAVKTLSRLLEQTNNLFLGKIFELYPEVRGHTISYNIGLNEIIKGAKADEVQRNAKN